MSDTAPQPVISAEDAPILSLFSPRMSGHHAQGDRTRRVLFGCVAATLAMAVITQLSNQSRGAGGPSSSTYATSTGGLAALATLLERSDVRILRLTRPIAEAWADSTVEPNDTLVVLGQDLSAADIGAVRNHLGSGGRLVAGGRDAAPWMSAVVSSRTTEGAGVADGANGAGGADGANPVAERSTTLRIRPGAPGTLTYFDARGTRTLTTIAGPDVFIVSPARSAVAVAGTDQNDAPAILRTSEMVLLADPSVLANATLATTDNAAVALDVLSPKPGGRIVFAEAGLGFRSGRGAGLAAIPGPVRTLLFGLALAALLWMLAVGRRIGDPDRPDRPLAPGRYEHVAAVAGLLDRANRRSRIVTPPEATAPTAPAAPPEPPAPTAPAALETPPAKDR